MIKRQNTMQSKQGGLLKMTDKQKKGPTRREFLKETLAVAIPISLGAAGLAGLFKWYSAPDISNVEEVAQYIKGLNGKVTGWRDNGGDKLVYILPDIHVSSYRKMHANHLEVLVDKFGLNLVGIEGAIGQRTREKIEREFELNKKEFETVKEHPSLATVLDNEIRRGKKLNLNTINDYFEYKAVEGMAYNGKITLYGLEEIENQRVLLVVDIINKHYPQYAHTMNILKRVENPKVKDALTVEELKQLKDYAIKAEAFIKEKLATIPNAPEMDERELRENKEPTLHSFWNRLQGLRENYMLDIRSKDAVRLLSEAMDTQGQKQAAIIYGAGHMHQIIDALDQRGISYITFYEDPAKQRKEAEEMRKSSKKIRELYINRGKK